MLFFNYKGDDSSPKNKGCVLVTFHQNIGVGLSRVIFWQLFPRNDLILVITQARYKGALSE